MCGHIVFYLGPVVELLLTVFLGAFPDFGKHELGRVHSVRCHVCRSEHKRLGLHHHIPYVVFPGRKIDFPEYRGVSYAGEFQLQFRFARRQVEAEAAVLVAEGPGPVLLAIYHYKVPGNDAAVPEQHPSAYVAGRSGCPGKEQRKQCGNQSFHFFTGSRCIIIWVSGPNSFLSLCSTLEQWA